ncbi:MBL fold metallo-hydrolase [Pseudorhodoferax sp. Leaf267]|uniref:MBL fold metallo-hydrolase n=1 Tax=Pseudorhodoferax sp. Leaf267 TaxID=1736316 RepID=UPI0006FE5840|nr:MBL fold metallo-hydrolase [Pseudorhodoferax sp. Leaf267]KQP21617.1 MBL fold metallo-hydrolase [Pseudorhodoferax sp. Leaf267]
MATILLPAGATLFERGWLSSNNLLLQDPAGRGPTALIDSGYCTHATQTLALVAHALQGAPLERLLNTHLHSDHCGGNAALQQRYPGVHTAIPPGQAAQVRDWDFDALSYGPTGQECPRFRFDATLQPGSTVQLGAADWQVHAAPGHDPHAVVLFEPATRTLVSADALWQNGFGVVFPELEGDAAFAEVGATLDLIERLAPAVAIPGHGSVFDDVVPAIARARRRLDSFVAAPLKHAHYAAKVLLKFKLLELQRIAEADLLAWAQQTAYLRTLHARHFAAAGDLANWSAQLVDDLLRSGAAAREGALLVNL